MTTWAKIVYEIPKFPFVSCSFCSPILPNYHGHLIGGGFGISVLWRGSQCNLLILFRLFIKLSESANAVQTIEVNVTDENAQKAFPLKLLVFSRSDTSSFWIISIHVTQIAIYKFHYQKNYSHVSTSVVWALWAYFPSKYLTNIDERIMLESN